MEQGRGRFGLWVGLCCAVPLAALAAVLLFNAPTLLTSLAAFAALVFIAPHLLAGASGSAGEDTTGTPGAGDRTRSRE